MRKEFLFLSFSAAAVGLLLAAYQVGAMPARIATQSVAGGPDFGAARLQTSRVDRTLVLPENADKSPVISLGTAIDSDTGDEVEGYAIVHYRAGNLGMRAAAAKGRTPKCYGFLASGAKWKTVEPWLVNPLNSSSLANDFVFANLGADAGKWESAALKDVLGNGAITSDNLLADLNAPDGLNEVYFADVSDPGAIAVTIVWGYFSGPPSSRRLIEWDQVYDDVDYAWSASGEAGKMDFENIATHELGHSVGMADIYESACNQVTMYGYADFGETNKRTLELPDVAGVQSLYR